jgi:transposase
MIEQRIIFEIHRMKEIGLSMRAIARNLRITRKTVVKYLENPNPGKPTVKRASKLDPFKDEIAKMLDMDSTVSGQVIRQRLIPLGFDGGKSILNHYLQTIRKQHQNRRAFIRFESRPGEQFQIDWGHFGALEYGKTKRKLYSMAIIECHSRLLYLEFTHSQRQETLHRCLLNAFHFFGGTARELVHDNMLTAVIERDGQLIRYNEAFLSFLRPFQLTPFACNPGKPHEKGKIEKGAIHYIRNSFWPLRSFQDLVDVQNQATHWRDTVANVRVHRTTGERPVDRFKPESMRPLPEFLPDCHDTADVRVYPDFCIHFDGNTYTAPPWLIGKRVTAKGDSQTVCLYFKEKRVVSHQRSWERGKRVELPEHHEAARKNLHKHWLSNEVAILFSLGEEAKTYVERLSASRHPLKKTVKRLLLLMDEYGSLSLIEAMKKALSHHAYGADYIENILYQEMTPQRQHPPLRLNQEALNRIRLQEPSLADYDAFVVRRRKRHDGD